MVRRTRDPRSSRSGWSGSEDPLEVLGLDPSATEDDIRGAKRRLAKTEHPDAGGSVERMQRVNDAARAALAAAAHRGADSSHDSSHASSHARTSSHASSSRRGSGWRHGDREPDSPQGGPIRRDHPSFTVEALPAEVFEALLVVVSWFGDVIDDDPPYGLEWLLSDPPDAWCRLDLVPDGGGSSVSVSVASAPGGRRPRVDVVRDCLVDGLNRLDWSTLE